MFKSCFLILEADTINGMTATRGPLCWKAFGDGLMLAEPMEEAARRRRSVKTPVGPRDLGVSLATAAPHSGPDSGGTGD